MKKQILAATALLACTSVIATAQTTTPPAPPSPAQVVSHKVARLSTLLDLTSAQQTSATTIFTTEETALATVRTGMHTARTALQTDIKGDNTADIAVQAAAIGTLTTQEVQAQGTADAAFYAILTADQQSKYETLGPRGPGGPGGFGGPGPHGGTH
ncbi:MAG TPA: Spy/CpxP family protein refolding chaperone [Bryobacteraceae bacterium]|nr:Spy/CpxP family protein refolding chaperone [Bryobacteraceae bacterium]